MVQASLVSAYAQPRVLPDTSAQFDALTLSLSDDGLIEDCSGQIGAVTGYRFHELSGRPVSTLLPDLAELELTRGGHLNPRLAYLCHCGRRFRVMRRDGTFFSGELFVLRLDDGHNRRLRVIIRPTELD